MTKPELTQPQRLIVLIIEVLLLISASCLALGHVPGPSDSEGFWFYSACLSCLIGSRIATPYFQRPADVFATVVPALIALLFAQQAQSSSGLADGLRYLLIVFQSILLAGCLVAITANDSTSKFLSKIALLSKWAIEHLGTPQFIYLPILVFAVLAYHQQSSTQVTIILVTSFLIAGSRLIEWFFQFFLVFLEKASSSIDSRSIGFVSGLQWPNLILIRQTSHIVLKAGDALLINDLACPDGTAVFLDYAGRDEALVARALVATLGIDSGDAKEIAFDMPKKHVRKIDSQANSIKINDQIEFDTQQIVGIVAPETSVNTLYFEITNPKDLSIGRLVECETSNCLVTYQIVEGVTQEEAVQQKNRFGFIRAQGRSIGSWSNTEQKFKPSYWLPNLNAPVKLLEKTDSTFHQAAIGFLPGTNYPALLKNVHDLVTHNTAILGILGVGKSSLAFELVERMILEGIKVIALDLTDEYQSQLSPYVSSGDADLLEHLKKTGAAGKNNCQENRDEGGSKIPFYLELVDLVKNFVTDDKRQFLVINPSSFRVWQQDGWVKNGTAPMVQLTPTEITRLISEAALKNSQDLGPTQQGKARLCLIYEEAHSLIPEWNSVAFDGDKAASAGTAKAILQGRKFGLGCLLISQRTANVTKTILNQCNTVFAMRTFDDTGKDFLANYLGSEYAKVLSSIPERHAVFFGKASHCENPILVKLNTRETFLEGVRKPKGT